MQRDVVNLMYVGMVHCVNLRVNLHHIFFICYKQSCLQYGILGKHYGTCDPFALNRMIFVRVKVVRPSEFNYATS